MRPPLQTIFSAELLVAVFQAIPLPTIEIVPSRNDKTDVPGSQLLTAIVAPDIPATRLVQDTIFIN